MRASTWMTAAYGGYFAAIGCFFPYIVLYYRHLELTGPQIGILSSVQPLAAAFLAPLWGMAADRWGIHRLLLRAALAAAAAAGFLLTQVASFVPILLLIGVLAVCAAPILPLLDSYGITLGERGNSSYGRMRLGGSFGFMITAPLLGWIMGGTASGLLFAGYGLMLLLTFGTTLGLPQLELPARAGGRSGTREVLRHPMIIVLLAVVYLVSSSSTPMFSFLGLWIAELGGGTSMVGTANAISAVSEAPVLFVGGTLLARFGSRRMLALALTAYVVRLLVYTVVPSATWALPAQLLHGPSFGIYLMASVTLVHEIAGRRLAATGQTLLASALGFGQITGSLVGGALLDRIGVFAIYRISVVVMALALAVYLLGLRRFGHATTGATAMAHAEGT